MSRGSGSGWAQGCILEGGEGVLKDVPLRVTQGVGGGWNNS